MAKNIQNRPIVGKEKKNKKKRKGNQTPGSSKGDNCKASILDRYFSSRNRSYKHPEYSNWCRRCDVLNNK